MAADRAVSEPVGTTEVAAVSPAERLERGLLLRWPVCPFPLPCEADRALLFRQRLGSRAHKNISYDPRTGEAHGFRRQSAVETEQLHRVLGAFSEAARSWLVGLLPEYADHWRLDRATFRPDEEAVRPLRWNARNDLVHIDAFPTRPTHGWRILRLFVNLNPADDRVWATSENFATLLERFGAEVGLPPWRLDLWSWLRPHGRRPAYDDFMLRFHHFLKANDDFQERCPKRYWYFPPGSAWLLFTDGLSYADLRGQFALEHSFFIAPHSLVLPDQAPAAILDRLCRGPGLGRAA
jgi:hypothetical protein